MLWNPGDATGMTKRTLSRRFGASSTVHRTYYPSYQIKIREVGK